MEKVKKFLPWLGCIAAILLISAAFFWPDAFDGGSLRQHDMQQGAANGQELVAHRQATGTTAWWTNSLFGGMPAYQISPSYASSGLLSWVNSLFGLFLPAPANLLCMMMLGMLLLLATMKCKPWVALLGAIAWGLSSYFVIIIGAGHLWKFITLAYVPPTIAGMVLIYNRHRLAGAGIAALFMALQIQSNHLQMSYYFAWVMAGFAIAYGIDAWRSKALKQWGISTGILAGAMLLAVAANLPSLYHTWDYSKHTMRGQHSELSPEAGAQQQPSPQGLDLDYITMYSYEKGETFSLLIPNVKGGASAKPVKGGMVPCQLTDSEDGKKMAQGGGEMTLLQLFSNYFGGAEGTNGPVYVGAIIMALFVLGCISVRGPLKWALVVLTVLSIMLAWGRHCMWLTELFVNYVPMYNKFRTVESILVIAEFTIPLLGVLGLREFMLNPSKHLKPMLWSFGGCIALCLVAILSPSIFGSLIMGERDLSVVDQYVAYGMLPEGFNLHDYPSVLTAVESMRAGIVKADALRSMLFLGLGLILLFAAAKHKLKPALAAGGLCLFVLIDLYGVDKRYVNHESFVTPAASTAPFQASYADKAILADPDPNYRVLDAVNFGGANASYFHKSVGGYHAAKLTRYQDLIDRHLSYVGRPEAAQLLSLRNDSVAAQYSPSDVAWLRSHLAVLDMLNTKYIIVNPESEPVRNTGAMGNAWLLDKVNYVAGADAEMAALETTDLRHEAVADEQFAAILGNSSPASPSDTIFLTSYAPDKLTYKVKLAKPRVAAFSEIFYPEGWQAEAQGKPLEIGRVNYVLRAISLPAGEYELSMTFAPASISVTNTVAYTAIALIYLLLLLTICACLKHSSVKE